MVRESTARQEYKMNPEPSDLRLGRLARASLLWWRSLLLLVRSEDGRCAGEGSLMNTRVSVNG